MLNCVTVSSSESYAMHVKWCDLLQQDGPKLMETRFVSSFAWKHGTRISESKGYIIVIYQLQQPWVQLAL